MTDKAVNSILRKIETLGPCETLTVFNNDNDFFLKNYCARNTIQAISSLFFLGLMQKWPAQRFGYVSGESFKTGKFNLTFKGTDFTLEFSGVPNKVNFCVSSKCASNQSVVATPSLDMKLPEHMGGAIITQVPKNQSKSLFRRITGLWVCVAIILYFCCMYR